MQATRTWTPRAAYFWRRAAKPAAICSRSRASCADRSGSSASGSIPPPPDAHSSAQLSQRGARQGPPAGAVLNIFQCAGAPVVMIERSD
eukprot:COSAG01_NODE_1911_length_8925_cov_151.747111_13_plen_89_part_00